MPSRNGCAIERLNPAANASRARVALFDFDGTVSLIRSGWVGVMAPMMVEILLELKTGESETALRELVEEYVGRLTGRQTMYQMIELCRQIELRGGTPLEPLAFKLDGLIVGRIEGLRQGRIPPDQMMVPGARRLLDALRGRGLKMYLASGTDQPYMREEARLLQIEHYFDGGVFGALDDYKSFSKKILIERIISGSEFRGEQFLGFGDGYVEIENIKEVGGVAVGVATDEPLCVRVDEAKRRRLAGVGADWIVPNFNCYHELMSALFSQ
jgi:phosphoglycolate phosphatase-like HAD superfamily hydrolase